MWRFNACKRILMALILMMQTTNNLRIASKTATVLQMFYGIAWSLPEWIIATCLLEYANDLWQCTFSIWPEPSHDRDWILQACHLTQILRLLVLSVRDDCTGFVLFVHLGIAFAFVIRRDWYHFAIAIILTRAFL